VLVVVEDMVGVWRRDSRVCLSEWRLGVKGMGVLESIPL
jgi:hypothetical protein